MDKKSKIKVVFVCYGNICRSTMAEFMFSEEIKKRGIEDGFSVSSRATSDEEEGNPVYYAAAQTLTRHGIPFSANKRAQRLSRAECDEADYLICMDNDNLSSVRALAGEKNRGKARLLLSFAGENASVSDPWWTRDFEKAYFDIERGIKAFLTFLDEDKK